MLSGSVLAQSVTTISKPTNSPQEVDQLYQSALDALARNQPDQARQVLEQVVAINPLFAGAWLDLAIATHRSGNSAAALEHFLYLKGQFVMPAPLAIQVEHWIKQLEESSQPATRTKWQGEIWLGLGKDSNANLGLLRDQIALSLPTGNVILNVTDSFRPRSDQYSMLGLALVGPGLGLPGGAHVSPVLLLRNKSFLTETDFNVLDIQAGLIHQTGTTQNVGWQTSLIGQNYQLGGQVQFNALRFGLQRSQPWGGCQTSGASVIETRAMQTQPTLGGNAFSVKAGLSCPLPGQATVAASLGAGFERANPNRAGGNNENTELGLRVDKLLSARYSVHANWQITQINDQTGFSPLVDNNAIRSINRQAFSLSLRQSITRLWQTRLSFDALKQQSNLSLFEKKASQIMLGLYFQIE